MNRQRRNLITLGLISLALAGCVVLGIYRTCKVANTLEKPSPSSSGLPSIGGPFELVDKAGKLWKDTDFKGKPLLIYFGYTYCPDICPTALYTMSQAVETLGGASVIQPLFITIDPRRDTPTQLQNYSQNFLKDFIMLTGSQEQVKHALTAYRVHAARAGDERGPEDYLMDHSSLIYVMGRDGQYVAHFNHQSAPQDIIDRVKEYLQTVE